MLQKHKILIGISLSLVLLVIATRYYPGGSYFDAHSTGFVWGKNYFCNLFNSNAVNGKPNSAQPWAIAGIIVLCTSFALFFIDFSKKIPDKRSAAIIKYAGAGAMFFAFFAATPFHDPALTLTTTFGLLSIFYITVYVFRSKLHWFKAFSVLCMLVWYACNFVYYSQMGLEYLPVLQKISLLVTITWILGLHYFTSSSDFAPKINTP